MSANYRAVSRAKSTADFINKLKIVEEEADESQFFLELIDQINTKDELNLEVKRLIQEANEFVAIVVSSLKTARTNIK